MKLTPTDHNALTTRLYVMWQSEVRDSARLRKMLDLTCDEILCFDLPDAGRRKGLPLILDDGAWRKVRSVDAAGEVETWNLRVEEDESFTVEGCIVKNCPLQFDIVDRLITQLSQPGEVVLDPFAGLMTVPYCALKLGRQGIGIELSQAYWADGVTYCEAAARDVAMPDLFSLAEREA